MDYFRTLFDDGFEALHFLTDKQSGLRALVAVHSTKRGAALGGTRALASYASEEEAVKDVKRLARGMTYKAAIAGLPHGGGKAVIMLPKGYFDRGALFEAFGRAVHSLGGRYITTEDSGTSPDDMEFVRRHTSCVVGLKDRSGDPSPVTALGVVRGMEACAKHLFGSPSLEGRKVTLLGAGHVGWALLGELVRRKAKVYVSDIQPEKAHRAAREFGVTAVSDPELFDVEADFFSPCALGGVLNDQTIPRLRVRCVAGAANNQLEEPRHGQALADRNILYAPDYAINGGGLINVAQEVAGYDREKALARAGKIYDTVDEILTRAAKTGRRPELVADAMAEERLV